MTTYKILRFTFKGKTQVIARGLTLEEAQAHCRDPATSKREKTGFISWFDGYTKEE